MNSGIYPVGYRHYRTDTHPIHWSQYSIKCHFLSQNDNPHTQKNKYESHTNILVLRATTYYFRENICSAFNGERDWNINVMISFFLEFCCCCCCLLSTLLSVVYSTRYILLTFPFHFQKILGTLHTNSNLIIKFNFPLFGYCRWSFSFLFKKQNK